MSKTNFDVQMDEILAANNIDMSKTFGATQLKAYAVAIQSAGNFAPLVLPSELAIVKEPQDVPVAIKRVVSDEGFFLATLRAAALFVTAKIKGEQYDSAKVSEFYELFQKSSDADKLVAHVGTLRLFADILVAETKRCMIADGKPDVEGTVAEITELFDEVVKDALADKPEALGRLQVNLEQGVMLVTLMGQTIQKAEANGETVERALDINRETGQLNGMMLGMLCVKVATDIVRETFALVLPKDQFDIVEALAEREVEKDFSGSSALH